LVDVDDALAEWAPNRPEVLALFVFGSGARGDARPDSDLDLAFELDDTRESQLTVLVVNHEQWQRELSVLTGLVVRDLYLWGDPEVTGPVRQIYGREADDLDLLRLFLGKKNSRLRAANSYWYWPDKPVAERGAARLILEEAGFAVTSLASCTDANLPPDCEAIVDGVPAGIEVTELVHERALARSINSNKTWWFLWDQAEFVERLQRIISIKSADGNLWQGGPYGRRVLVVHTDEPYLDHERVSRFLVGQEFKTAFFSDVVLGLPYGSFTQSHPVFRLPLGSISP
jgi:predicted nucleotidyltransferase